MKSMSFFAVLLLILFSWLFVAQSSHADEDSCTKGKHAFEQFRYDEAISYLGKCIENEEVSKEQRAEAHKLLGFCFIAFDIRWQAKENFKKTLKLDPSFDPTTDPVWGAKASEVFLEAKREHFTKVAARLADQENNEAIKAAFALLEKHRKENKFSPQTMKKLYQNFLNEFSGSKDSPYYLEVEAWLIQSDGPGNSALKSGASFNREAMLLIKKGKGERTAGIVFSTAVPTIFFAWGGIRDSNADSIDEDNNLTTKVAFENEAMAGYTLGYFSLVTGITLCVVGHAHIVMGEEMQKGITFLKRHKPEIALNFDKNARFRSLGIGFSW